MGVDDVELLARGPQHRASSWCACTDWPAGCSPASTTLSSKVLAFTLTVRVSAMNAFGKGRAVTLGYPFGAEAVECEAHGGSTGAARTTTCIMVRMFGP